MNSQRLLDTLLKLVAVPSISGSAGELAMAQTLRNLLLTMDYFRDHPKQVSLLPAAGDSLGRSAVCALFEGDRSRSTVVLLSHYDVVETSGYGLLQEFAWQPDELQRRLQTVPLPDEAVRDLGSGDYLFGRGVMDMKFGIALHLELLRQWSEAGCFPGNILFLSVPDEEANSIGMLSAVPELLRLKEGGLDFQGAINSEPFFPAYPGDTARYIYTGTVGKLLPLVFCSGRQTHAGEPFSGLNPDLMLSMVVQMIETNPTLAETSLGSTSAPPVCLKMSDLKEDYSVQTPAAAYAYFNLITLDREPAACLEAIKQLVQAAMREAAGITRRASVAWHAQSGAGASAAPAWDPPVFTFQELLEICSRSTGDSPEVLTRKITGGLAAVSLQEATARCVQHLLSYCPIQGPLAVIALAPPYYPHSSLGDGRPLPSPASRPSPSAWTAACGTQGPAEGLDAADDPGDRRMRKVSSQVAARARERHGVQLVEAPFFPALSDMSYLRLGPGSDSRPVAANTPLWNVRYQVPLEAIQRLNIPFINIGPQGKDAHRFTERLYLPYSLQVVPDLLRYAVKLLLQT
jgi:arginine utilization protein RocB